MIDSLFGLRGKAALVIGGGQGMGETTSLLLAKMGCKVAVVDISTERAERVARSVRELGSASCALTADILDENHITRVVHQAETELEGLDAMIGIVGQAQYAPLLEMTGEQWDLDHRRNLRYFFVAAREVAASLVRRSKPGAIVGIASVSGLQSAPKHAAYGAAKAGLVNLVKSMAVEWAPHGIRVNAVAPGSITTPRRPDSPERQREMAESAIPMQRRGTTDDVGKAALYLISDMAGYVTGHTLAVDGGWMAASLYRR
jgi:NAD(P)-dependent dehydrogenase (short-subunit alcohol dehydrogenase family)